MACYRQWPNVYVKTRQMFQSGLWAKPAWYDGARRSPPPFKYVDEKPKEVTFPEDKLYDALLKRMPMLELEEEAPTSFKRGIAHRFARKQQAYLEQSEHIKEAEAFDMCLDDFSKEIKGFEDHLSSLHKFGAKQVSFHSIQENLSVHARISGTIAKLLETRIDVQHRGPLYEDPLDSPYDSPARRRAKVQRLMHDPAVAHVKQIFAPQKPSVLVALEQLIHQYGGPKGVTPKDNAAFWQSELEKFMMTLRQALYNFSEANSTTKATVESTAALIPRVSNVLTLLKGAHGRGQLFASLPKEDQKEIVMVAQEGLAMKIIPETVKPLLSVSTQTEKAQMQVRDLRQTLAVEDNSRSPKEIMGRQEYSEFVESNFWPESEERKEFLKQIEIIKQSGGKAGKRKKNKA